MAGDNGSISDKSFGKVIDTVTEYKENKVTRVEVEDVLNHLENSRDEKAPSTVSRGSSLEENQTD